MDIESILIGLNDLERAVMLDMIERKDSALLGAVDRESIFELIASKSVDISNVHWNSIFTGFSAQDGRPNPYPNKAQMHH
jgi:hypothetical protein